MSRASQTSPLTRLTLISTSYNSRRCGKSATTWPRSSGLVPPLPREFRDRWRRPPRALCRLRRPKRMAKNWPRIPAPTTRNDDTDSGDSEKRNCFLGRFLGSLRAIQALTRFSVRIEKNFSTPKTGKRDFSDGVMDRFDCIPEIVFILLLQPSVVNLLFYYFYVPGSPSWGLVFCVTYQGFDFKEK